MTTHRLQRRSARRTSAAVPAGGFADLVLVYRIGCHLCGRAAHAEPGLQDPEASAAFAGRGWRSVRRRQERLVVCRACARHLGPQWEPETADAQPTQE